MSVAARPTGAVRGAHVQTFSTTEGQKSITPKSKKNPVNSSVVFVLAIVVIVFYLEIS
jgi:hypothetical protein